MSAFKLKLNKLTQLRSKIDSLEKDLGSQIEAHLGDGWYITFDVADGILLLSPDAYNYEMATYLATLKMPREVAIAYIEARPFN